MGVRLGGWVRPSFLAITLSMTDLMWIRSDSSACSHWWPQVQGLSQHFSQLSMIVLIHNLGPLYREGLMHGQVFLCLFLGTLD